MLKVLCFCVILPLAIESLGQQKKLVAREYNYAYNTIYEVALFDSAEIKSRRIQTAYLRKLANDCINVNIDTILSYAFDSFGRVIKECFYDTNGISTNFFDSTKLLIRITHSNNEGNIISDEKINQNTSTISSHTPEIRYYKVGDDSIRTQILTEKKDNRIDTIFFIKSTFNLKGQLIENESKNNFSHPFLTHLKYQYDTLGRQILMDNLIHRYKIYTSYLKNGRLEQKVNGFSGLIEDATLYLKNENDIQTITNNQKHVLIVPYTKGSKLVRLISVLEMESIPVLQTFEITYQ